METVHGIRMERNQHSARLPEIAGQSWRALKWLRQAGILAPVLAVGLAARGQDRPPTVRRHVTEVDNPMYPPEMAQAEAAMDKKDYATAEALLQKVVAKKSDNF